MIYRSDYFVYKTAKTNRVKYINTYTNFQKKAVYALYRIAYVDEDRARRFGSCMSIRPALVDVSRMINKDPARQ